MNSRTSLMWSALLTEEFQCCFGDEMVQCFRNLEEKPRKLRIKSHTAFALKLQHNTNTSHMLVRAHEHVYHIHIMRIFIQRLLFPIFSLQHVNGKNNSLRAILSQIDIIMVLLNFILTAS